MPLLPKQKQQTSTQTISSFGRNETPISSRRTNSATRKKNNLTPRKYFTNFSNSNKNKYHHEDFLAGQLVTDTIIVPPETQQKKEFNIQNFKLQHCTPTRQHHQGIINNSASNILQQQQQQLQGFPSIQNQTNFPSLVNDDYILHRENNNMNINNAVASPSRVGSAVRSVQRHNNIVDMNNNNSYSSIPRFHHQVAAAQHSPHVHFSPSPPPPVSSRRQHHHQSLFPPSTSRKRNNTRNSSKNKKDDENSSKKEKNTASDISAAAGEDEEHHQFHELYDSNGNPKFDETLSSVKRQLDSFSMHFASEQIRYERRRHELEKSQQNMNNNDAASDRSSSTDSIVQDPGVTANSTAKGQNRRSHRLRDHYSASIDALQQTSTSSADSVLLAYLMGLERLVSFCFNTLSSKEELASIVGALSHASGMGAEGVNAFSRWPCFNIDSINSRLDKLLPGKLDRQQFFECFSGVLHDGRVLHPCLLSALRLIFYSPSPAHFIEFILTVLFVHQSNLSQLDCQIIWRFLSSPHPLRFLVRGRKEDLTTTVAASFGIQPKMTMSNLPSKKEQQQQKHDNDDDDDEIDPLNNTLTTSEGGTSTQSIPTPSSQQQQQQKQKQKQKQNAQKNLCSSFSSANALLLSDHSNAHFGTIPQQNNLVVVVPNRKVVDGLHSAAFDVDAKVSGQELYFLINYIATIPALPGGIISFGELQRLVTPMDDGDGGFIAAEVHFGSNISGKSGGGGGDGGGVGVASGDFQDLEKTNPREFFKAQRQHNLLLHRHHVAMEERRKQLQGDSFGGTINRKQNLAECVIISKLMSELKQP